jgi:hypothetical protein
MDLVAANWGQAIDDPAYKIPLHEFVCANLIETVSLQNMAKNKEIECCIDMY